MPVPTTPQDLIDLIREKLFNNTSGIIDEPSLREVLENIVKVLDAKFSMFSPNLTKEQYAQWNLILDFMLRETKGVLTTSSSAPTGNAAIGKYLLSGAGTYTNLGGLVATADKLNYAYFDGTTWSKVEVQATQNVTQNIFNNTYNLDPEQIVPSEALYTDDTLAGDILKRVDINTGENVNYRETTTWHDGSSMDDSKVDGVIYLKKGSKYIKRVYADYADVRWFGAKGDGVDKGIGNYEGDHDAINLALRTCKRVKLEKGTFIVKKPIVLNDGNELYIASEATVKLGDGANCTVLKNSHVDLYKDDVGNVTYPNNFKRHRGIKVHGGGVIDCNGWMQNRANDTNVVKDNPAVINTPTFPDGNGNGSYYFGCAIKFADIDNLEFSNLTIKNPRTYGFLAAGLRRFSFNNLTAERTYSVVNQDFMHFHGDCYDGEVHDLYGVSGDDFVAVTTREAGDLTLRKGDFKRVKFYNFFYFGIDPAATPTSQIPMSQLGIESGFPSHRCLRLSYSGNDVIDDIIIDNINATNSKIHCPFIFSKLPFSAGTTEAEKYSGTGYIGKVSISRLIQTNSTGIIGTSDYVRIKHIILSDIDDIRILENDGRSIIEENEDFIGTNPNFTHAKIENLTIRDFNSYIGSVNPSKAYIDWRGEISRLVIDNFSSYSVEGTTGYLDVFLSSNIKNVFLLNSKLDRYNKIFDLTNSDGFLKESNCRYLSLKQLETQLFINASSNTLVLNNNSTVPYLGQMVLTDDGMKTLSSSGWVLM